MKAFCSSGLIAARRAGLPSRNKTRQRLTISNVLLGLFIAALGFLLQRRSALFEAVEIRQHQLGFDRLDIVERRNLASNMRDVIILETAHDMGDGVAFADIGEKLIAETFPLRGPAHEAGDIDEGKPRRDDFFGAGDLRQNFEPRIGHGDIADVRLDRAERIIGRLRRRRLRQRVEKSRLADVRQTDNAAFKAHESLFSEGMARALASFARYCETPHSAAALRLPLRASAPVSNCILASLA